MNNLIIKIRDDFENQIVNYDMLKILYQEYNSGLYFAQ